MHVLVAGVPFMVQNFAIKDHRTVIVKRPVIHMEEKGYYISERRFVTILMEQEVVRC